MPLSVTGAKMSSMIATVRTKCKALDEETRTNLDNNLAVDFGEHFQYQQMQAEAHAMGLLTPEAAMIVYRALGEIGSDDNGGWSAETDLPTKIVVTQLMGELLTMKVKAARA